MNERSIYLNLNKAIWLDVASVWESKELGYEAQKSFSESGCGNSGFLGGVVRRGGFF